MSVMDPDRLISASEVERWSYCPLSWYLERRNSTEISDALDDGIREHGRIGRKVNDLRSREAKTRESRSITIAYLAFASVLVTTSLLLLLLTNTNVLRGDVWQGVVVIIASALLVVSLSMYLFRTLGPGKEKKRKMANLIRGIEKSPRVGSYFPYLSYIFGILLLLNGIMLLRPLGIPDRKIVTFFTLSLVLLYFILLISLVAFFMRARKRKSITNLKLGFIMLIILLVGLSILFIILSERFDPDNLFGWIFLIIAFIWFIGAMVYDTYKGFRSERKKKTGLKREDLPMTTIALMSSVFIVMSFLTRGENLKDYHTLSIIMAGLWLAGAVFFFLKGSSDQRTASKEREELDLPEGSNVVSVDDIKDSKRGRPLVSRKHFLVGSPDILIEEKGKKIPVEIKTGKVPDRPHLSHVMQLGVYLILVDVNYRQETPYGYIEYVSGGGGSRKRHKVEWDMLTKALVLSKVSEIRDAERRGTAHRDHKREGKCRNCSRRSNCPERLV